MAEAYVLAGELARAEGAHREVFDAYETRLRPVIEAKQDGSRKLISFFATRTSIGIWFRDLAMRTMNVPLPADSILALLARSLRDDIELPDYGI
jgi:2-polyprenyl-6-methoxyphenol hydroxylase-like FAD-dependent oxidoreductase